MRKLTKLAALTLSCVLCASTSMTALAFSDAFSSSTWDWAWEHIMWAENNGIVAGKGENCFDADGIVTRAEAATMMVKFKGIDADQYDAEVSEQFEDADGEWYTRYINAAYANQLITGKTETTFDPNGELTRAEAATLIVAAMDYEVAADQEASFTDIEGDWYTDYINTAYAHEVVAGKGDGIFNPNATVTRAEMVTMIHATLKENFEIGMLGSISSDVILRDYILTNAEGQSHSIVFDEEHKHICNMPDCMGDIWYVPTGCSLDTTPSSSLTFEYERETIEGITFFGDNSIVDVSGTNIDKIQVNADGTIYLYGTDMEYTVSIENMAHTLEYSDTGADDVILKVVDKQLVEVTE